MMVRLAASTLAWVSAAPRGTTSTAAVEMTANTSSPDTSAAGHSASVRYSAAKGAKPGAAVSPNWYQWVTARWVAGQSAATPSVEPSTTIIRGAARSTTRFTSWAVRRQLIG